MKIKNTCLGFDFKLGNSMVNCNSKVDYKEVNSLVVA